MKTPANVRMINTSPAELAWLLAGVVYPEHADEEPDRYVSDFHLATGEKVSKKQTKAWTARLMAAKFIQKLLSKVGVGVQKLIRVTVFAHLLLHDRYRCIVLIVYSSSGTSCMLS